MKHKYLFFNAIIIIMLFNQNIKAQINTTELGKLIEQVRKKYDLPALAVVVMNSRDIIASDIQGVRVHNTAEKAHVNDYFHIGSCTKSVTAIMASKLIEDGRINWHTPFFDIYPELKNACRQEYCNITLEDLLLCKAGINAYTSADEKYPQLEDALSNARYLFSKYLLQQPPASNYDKGKFDFLYSNASYALAACMLEGVTGKTYEELIELYLVQELGMRVFVGFPNTLDSSQPWGHSIGRKTLDKYPPNHEYKLHDLITPAGGLSMCPNDFARFIQMNLKGLRGTDNFVSSQSYNYIHFSRPGFSLGFGNSKFGGHQFSGIDGSAGTFFCRAILMPDADFAFTIMTNAGSATGKMKSVDWLSMKILKKQYNWWWKFWM